MRWVEDNGGRTDGGGREEGREEGRGRRGGRRKRNSRESRSGLSDTILSSRGLRGVTRKEPVLSLVRVEEGDRRKNTESVASEVDDVLGLIW